VRQLYQVLRLLQMLISLRQHGTLSLYMWLVFGRQGEKPTTLSKLSVKEVVALQGDHLLHGEQNVVRFS